VSTGTVTATDTTPTRAVRALGQQNAAEQVARNVGTQLRKRARLPRLRDKVAGRRVGVYVGSLGVFSRKVKCEQ